MGKMPKPKSILLFDRLFLSAIVLGIAAFAYRWSETSALFASTPEASALGMGSGFLIGTFAVGMAINLVIWYFISHRGSKVAKWVQVVLYGLGLVFFLTSLNNPLSPKGLVLAGNLVIYALYGAATYMLFRPDTVAWFGNDRVDPDAFR